MLNGRWPHSWCEIGTLVGAFNQEKVLVGPSTWLWNIHEPSDNLRLKLYTNCHLHSCLRLWCGREERIWRSHEYEYEESRFRQTSLTGLDQDRQLAHSHLRYNTDFFLRCLSATAATCSPAPAPSPHSAAVSRDSMLNKKSDQRVDSVLVPGTASPWTSAVNLLFVLSEAGWMASLELRITIAAQYSETFINFLKPIDCSWYCSLVR